MPARIVGEKSPEWWVFHVLNRQAAADWTLSRRSTPGGEGHRLVFPEDNPSAGTLFLEDRCPQFWLTTEPGGFKSFVDTHGVTGLTFRKEYPLPEG